MMAANASANPGGPGTSTSVVSVAVVMAVAVTVAASRVAASVAASAAREAATSALCRTFTAVWAAVSAIACAASVLDVDVVPSEARAACVAAAATARATVGPKVYRGGGNRSCSDGGGQPGGVARRGVCGDDCGCVGLRLDAVGVGGIGGYAFGGHRNGDRVRAAGSIQQWPPSSQRRP